jgi:hypothetical protein
MLYSMYPSSGDVKADFDEPKYRAASCHDSMGAGRAKSPSAWSSGNAQAASNRRTVGHGGRGSMEAPTEWRWTGHNGPPWFSAGGAGKLQVWRVIDRRYGPMTRWGSTPRDRVMRRGDATGTRRRVISARACAPSRSRKFFRRCWCPRLSE